MFISTAVRTSTPILLQQEFTKPPPCSFRKWENRVSVEDAEVGLNRTYASLVLHERELVGTFLQVTVSLRRHAVTASINRDLAAKLILTTTYTLYAAIRFIIMFTTARFPYPEPDKFNNYLHTPFNIQYPIYKQTFRVIHSDLVSRLHFLHVSCFPCS